MKYSTILVLSLIISVFAVYSCGKPGASTENADKNAVSAEISKLMDESITNANKLDADAAFMNISKDSNDCFIFSGKRFDPFTSHEMLKKVYSARVNQKLSFEKSEIKVISSEAALWIGYGKAEVTMKTGASFARYFNETWLWQKSKGKWEVTNLHESEMLPPSETDMKQTEELVAALAKKFESQNISPEFAFLQLEEFVKNNAVIYGSAFAFPPDANGKTAVNKALYVYRSKGAPVKVDISHNNLYQNDEWYSAPLAKKSGCWTAPYYDAPGGKIWMTTYSVPVYNPKSGELIGVVTGDLPMK